MPPGPSILDKLWVELVNQTGKLMELRASGEGHISEAGQAGHCLGLAKAIAIVLNPYDPNVDEVRREVMRRYREGATA